MKHGITWFPWKSREQEQTNQNIPRQSLLLEMFYYFFILYQFWEAIRISKMKRFTRNSLPRKSTQTRGKTNILAAKRLFYFIRTKLWDKWLLKKPLTFEEHFEYKTSYSNFWRLNDTKRRFFSFLITTDKDSFTISQGEKKLYIFPDKYEQNRLIRLDSSSRRAP